MATLQIDPRTGLPILKKDMFRTNPGSYEQVYQGGDSGSYADVYTPPQFEFTPEALSMLNAGNVRWGGQPNNIEWKFGMTPEEVEYRRRFGAVSMSDGFAGGLNPSVKIKTADKEGTSFNYAWDEAQQAYVPQLIGKEYWDTNYGDVNRKLALAIAGVVGGGLLGNLAMMGNMFTAAAPGAMNLGGAVGGAAGGAAAGSAGGSGAAGGSIFGPGGAFSGAGLTSTGLPGVTSLGVPASLGGDALLAGSSLSGALGGAGATAGLTSAGIPITAGLGLNALQVGAAGGIPVGATAGFGLPAGGFPGAGVPGNAPISPPTSPIEIPPTPPASPPSTPTPGTPPPGSPSPNPSPDGGFKLPSGWEDWLKLLGPVIGGGLAAWDAKNAQGENPQDPFTRDYLRGLLTGPQSSNQSSGLLGTIGQLQNKRYY